MAFKKIDKEFLITDSSVNVYGFRCLTSGYLVDEFKKNPIGYHNHADPDLTEFTREAGVLVRWEDFRQDGDAWFAKPVINLDHPRGQRTGDEVENGFLNGASVGKIIAIEISDDPSLMLPGQSLPTVTKWYNRELSLVDIPGNLNALSLCDENGNAINLADFKNHQSKNMKQIFLTPEMLQAMNLADNADANAVSTAFKDLVEKAKKTDQLQSQLTQALADKTDAETKLTNLETSTKKDKVKEMLDKALADKKITVALQKTLQAQYEAKPDELKNLLDNMQPYQSITEQISSEKTKIDEKFKSLSYQQLDKAGLLPSLKESNIDLFKEKFKAEYGVDYKG
jgi:hypothetical protein